MTNINYFIKNNVTNRDKSMFFSDFEINENQLRKEIDKLLLSFDEIFSKESIMKIIKDFYINFIIKK